MSISFVHIFNRDQIVNELEEKQRTVSPTTLRALAEKVLNESVSRYNQIPYAVDRQHLDELQLIEVRSILKEMMRLLVHHEAAYQMLSFRRDGNSLLPISLERFTYVADDAYEKAAKLGDRIVRNSPHSVERLLEYASSYRHQVEVPPEWYMHLLVPSAQLGL